MLIRLIIGLFKMVIAFIGMVLLVGGGWCAAMVLPGIGSAKDIVQVLFMLLPLVVAILGWMIMSAVNFKFGSSNNNQKNDASDQ